jgi:RNA polymerase sigma-70 factor, ECF subfamily
VIKAQPTDHQAPVVAMPAALALAPATTTSPSARLTAMFEEHVALIWRTLRRLGVAEAAVDDAVQEVFIVAARRLDAIATGKERAYLFGVAVRVAADARRRVQRRREDAEGELGAAADPALGPAELIDQRRARQLLDRIVSELPEDTRPVFLLYELEGLTMAEIAACLELPAGTVASRLRRGREVFATKVAALRAQLEPRGTR